MTYAEYTSDSSRGRYAVNGVEYVELDNPELTNHIFPGWWGDADQGESYVSQWSCPAAAASDFERDDFDPDDLSNPPVTLIFEFPAIKGQEPEDGGDWPWDDERYISANRHY